MDRFTDLTTSEQEAFDSLVIELDEVAQRHGFKFTPSVCASLRAEFKLHHVMRRIREAVDSGLVHVGVDLAQRAELNNVVIRGPLLKLCGREIGASGHCDQPKGHSGVCINAALNQERKAEKRNPCGLAEDAREIGMDPLSAMRIAHGRCSIKNPHPMAHVTDGPCVKWEGHDGICDWAPASDPFLTATRRMKERQTDAHDK